MYIYFYVYIYVLYLHKVQLQRKGLLLYKIVPEGLLSGHYLG